MSKGFGRVEMLILDYFTTYDEKEEAFVSPRQSEGLYQLVGCVTAERSRWHEEGIYPKPSPSQYRSVLRAVRTLESKGIVSTRHERRQRMCERCRATYLVVTLASDYLTKIPVQYQERFKRSHECKLAIK